MHVMSRNVLLDDITAGADVDVINNADADVGRGGTGGGCIIALVNVAGGAGTAGAVATGAAFDMTAGADALMVSYTSVMCSDSSAACTLDVSVDIVFGMVVLIASVAVTLDARRE